MHTVFAGWIPTGTAASAPFHLFTGPAAKSVIQQLPLTATLVLVPIQELRKQNEQYRQDLEQQDQRAQTEQEAALARKQEKHEEELKKLQAQVGWHLFLPCC